MPHWIKCEFCGGEGEETHIACTKQVFVSGQRCKACDGYGVRLAEGLETLNLQDASTQTGERPVKAGLTHLRRKVKRKEPALIRPQLF